MSKRHDDDELLSRVKVATPCSASWAEMRGGDRVRSCEHCQKKVYNLSEMTAREAAQLVRDSEGRMCVRYYQRADGTMLTQDCPTGVRRVRNGIARAVAAVAGSFLLVGGFMHRWRQAATLDNSVSYPAAHLEPPIIMGDMAAPEPVEVRMGKVVRPVEPQVTQGYMMGAPAIEPLKETMGRVGVRTPRVVELPMAPVKGAPVSDARRDPFARH